MCVRGHLLVEVAFKLQHDISAQRLKSLSISHRNYTLMGISIIVNGLTHAHVQQQVPIF